MINKYRLWAQPCLRSLYCHGWALLNDISRRACLQCEKPPIPGVIGKVPGGNASGGRSSWEDARMKGALRATRVLDRRVRYVRCRCAGRKQMSDYI
jgi:hypothetical protein